VCILFQHGGFYLVFLSSGPCVFNPGALSLCVLGHVGWVVLRPPDDVVSSLSPLNTLTVGIDLSRLLLSAIGHLIERVLVPAPCTPGFRHAIHVPSEFAKRVTGLGLTTVPYHHQGYLANWVGRSRICCVPLIVPVRDLHGYPPLVFPSCNCA